jgi:hypothetical protein
MDQAAEHFETLSYQCTAPGHKRLSKRRRSARWQSRSSRLFVVLLSAIQGSRR